jgi:hypothetical protein
VASAPFVFKILHALYFDFLKTSSVRYNALAYPVEFQGAWKFGGDAIQALRPIVVYRKSAL